MCLNFNAKVIVPLDVTFADAVDTCRRLGQTARLPRFDSTAEWQEFMLLGVGRIASPYLWFPYYKVDGGNSSNNSSSYVDYYDNSLIDSINWAVSQPNEPITRCVREVVARIRALNGRFPAKSVFCFRETYNRKFPGLRRYLYLSLRYSVTVHNFSEDYNSLHFSEDYNNLHFSED